MNRIAPAAHRAAFAVARRGWMGVLAVATLACTTACLPGSDSGSKSGGGDGGVGAGVGSSLSAGVFGDPTGVTATCIPAGLSGKGDSWAFSASVSKSAGLVLNRLRLGPRTAAEQISVPYVRIRTAADGPLYIGNLTATPVAGKAAQSRLTGPPKCVTDRGEPLVEATYSVSVPDANITVLVHQEYRFDTALDDECEATLTASCRRFWPSVSWVLPGSPGGKDVQVGIVQKFSFDPDALGREQVPGAANLIRDKLVPTLFNGSEVVGVGVDDLAESGRLKKSGHAKVLDGGKVAQWENWHQTGRSKVGLPAIVPGAVGGTAGCSECIHAHWSWFGLMNGSQVDKLLVGSAVEQANRAACKSADCWTDGKPQLREGSKQTACLGWTTAKVESTVDWCAGDGPKDATLGGDRPPDLYWDASSWAHDGLSDPVTFGGADFANGDELWPRLPNRDRGGDGSIFFEPARVLKQSKSATPRFGQANVRVVWPARETPAGAAGLPPGWVLPVVITPQDGDKGPFYLRVQTTGGAKLSNADDDWSADFGGAPWVRVYDDALRAKGPVRRLGPPKSVQSWSRGDPPLVALLAFESEPSPGSFSLQLDAAPNGVDWYVPSRGYWGSAQQAAPEDPSLAAPASDGWTYGLFNSVDTPSGTVRYDAVQWFVGPEIKAACREDDVEPGDGPRCNDYYFRNKNTQLRSANILDVPIRIVDETSPNQRTDLKAGTLADVAGKVSAGRALFRMRIEGGKVTAVEEVFLP